MNIEISIDEFEHLLNCLANQKFVHELSEEDRKLSQEAIDQAWHKGMENLSKFKKLEADKKKKEEKRKDNLKKFETFWGERVFPAWEKLKDKHDPDVYFKWCQLLQQELHMWASLNEEVKQEEFDFICERRGFSKVQVKLLIEFLELIELGKDLKTNKYKG